MPIALVDHRMFYSDRYKLPTLYFDRLAIALPSDWLDSARHSATAITPLLEAGILKLVEFTEADMIRASTPLIEALEANRREIREQYAFKGGWPEFGEFIQDWFPEILADSIENLNIGFRHMHFGRGMAEDIYVLRVAAKIGQMYSSALTDLIARRELFDIADDERCPFAGASDWDADAIAASLLAAGSSYAMDVMPEVVVPKLALFAVETVLPEDLSSLPLEKILELRVSNRRQLTAFQDFLDSMVKSGELATFLGRRSTLSAVQAHVEAEYERKIQPEIKELDESWRRLHLNTIWSAISFRMAVPPVIAASIGAMFPPEARRRRQCSEVVRQLVHSMY